METKPTGSDADVGAADRRHHRQQSEVAAIKGAGEVSNVVNLETKRNAAGACSICGEQMRGVTDNHNAYPVTNGRCCTLCNADTVIPARLFLIDRKRAR